MEEDKRLAALATIKLLGGIYFLSSGGWWYLVYNSKLCSAAFDIKPDSLPLGELEIHIRKIIEIMTKG